MHNTYTTDMSVIHSHDLCGVFHVEILSSLVFICFCMTFNRTEEMKCVAFVTFSFDFENTLPFNLENPHYTGAYIQNVKYSHNLMFAINLQKDMLQLIILSLDFWIDTIGKQRPVVRECCSVLNKEKVSRGNSTWNSRRKIKTKVHSWITGCFLHIVCISLVVITKEMK